MNRFHKSYYFVFIISIIICWSPLKPLAYILPLLVFGFLFIINFKKNIFSIKNLFFLSIIFCTSLAAAILNRDYIFQNGLLSILTYSTFIILFFFPSKLLANTELYKKTSKLLWGVLIFESFYGFMQLINSFMKNRSFDLSTGDAVDGTIHPSLASSGAFDNVMFAANLAFGLILIYPYLKSKNVRHLNIKILFPITILILASVMHLTLFAFLSLFIAYFLINPHYIRFSFKNIALSIIILLVPTLILVNFMATNLGLISHHLDKALIGENPKVKVTQRLLNDQEYPQIPYIGLGPGQFSSRASLIGTGLYFGSPSNPKNLPLLQPIVTKPNELYLMDLWMWVTNLPIAAGSTMKPFYSWLSLYAEFGLLGVILLFIAIIIVLIKIKFSANSIVKKRMGYALTTFIILLLLLGIQENYWEVSQALLIPLIYGKILYAKIIH